MIIDVFPFFNELDILEIRVNELKGIVDQHILVEADMTYTGKPKPLYYAGSSNRYRNVTAVGVTDMPRLTREPNPWVREGHQCEMAYRMAMSVAKEGDWLIVGDTDEIPSADVLKDCLATGPLALEMTTYACYLDWMAPNRKTLSPVILPYTWAKRLGSWAAIRKPATPFAIQLQAGWHFTDMGGPERNVAKLTSFSHAPEQGPTESVANILSGRETLFERYKREGCIHQIDRSYLPQYVWENIPRMVELGLLQG